jgi:sec-independent protein translocase protein TatA
MGFPGGMEWVLILLVFVLLFGAKKIPDLARGLGLGIKEFKKASRDVEKELTQKSDEESENSRKN